MENNHTTIQLTAFETLKLLTPQILLWKPSARILGFLLNNYPDGLALDGRHTNWQCIAYSAKNNKLASFQQNKPISFSGARPEVFRSKKGLLLDLSKLDEYSFLDSSWLATELVKLGLPLNAKGQIDSKINGGVDIMRERICWAAHYFKPGTSPREQWIVRFDMGSGELIEHSFVYAEK
jgi:hypothetical protein